MLKKLLKYDFKNMYNNYLVIFYILSIFFSVLTRVLFELKQTTIINIIGKISMGILISMIFNILINNLMRIWVRFKETIYSDEAYLTHTLPIKKETLYISKWILSLTTLITSFIIILISLIITFYSKSNILIVKEYINNLSGTLNINVYKTLIEFLIILFLEIASVMQSGYLGIILGNNKNNNKTLYSVIFGFITYLISQTVVLIALYIFGLFNNNIMNLFTSNTFNIKVLNPVINFSIIIYLVIIIINFIISINIFKKGVNVD